MKKKTPEYSNRYSGVFEVPGEPLFLYFPYLSNKILFSQITENQ